MRGGAEHPDCKCLQFVKVTGTQVLSKRFDPEVFKACGFEATITSAVRSKKLLKLDGNCRYLVEAIFGNLAWVENSNTSRAFRSFFQKGAWTLRVCVCAMGLVQTHPKFSFIAPSERGRSSKSQINWSSKKNDCIQVCAIHLA